jgi:hypothetical protein
MKIMDVAIFKNAHFNQSDAETKESFPPIQNKLLITDELFIDRLPREESLKVFSACEPKGFNFEPQRQFGQLYSFIRINPPESPPLEWDSDERLQLCIGLSRIIHPTTISFDYSCRLIYENNNISEIIPGPIAGFGAKTWVANEEHRDWLTELEGNELSSLFQTYQKVDLPGRVKGALWYLEYAYRSYFIDLRWPIVCMGLEYLTHTDPYKSTKQFTIRTAKLAEEVGISAYDENKAREAYDMRSTLVHGQLLRDLEEYKIGLYEEIEELLRMVLKRAILDSDFATIFESDNQIRERWPID